MITLDFVYRNLSGEVLFGKQRLDQHHYFVLVPATAIAEVVKKQ
jgi:hypothetical protein